MRLFMAWLGNEAASKNLVFVTASVDLSFD
jgi:hypothetical protein